MKQRYRPVTFRVDVAEYDFLVNACLSASARSISEFARTAVLQKAQQTQNPRQGTLSGDLTTLSGRLGELDALLEDMRKRIRTVLGSQDGDGNTSS